MLLMEGGVAGNFESFRRGTLGQIFELLLAEHGILEERSGAAAIFVSGNDEHSLAASYLAYCRAGFGERRCCLGFGGRCFGEIFLQIGILQTWSATALQSVVHTQNDVPPTFRAVKDAAAITESDRGLGQHYDPAFG